MLRPWRSVLRRLAESRADATPRLLPLPDCPRAALRVWRQAPGGGFLSRALATAAHKGEAALKLPELRLVSEEGKALGVMPPNEAIAIAQQRRLALVEVAAGAEPPVWKLMQSEREPALEPQPQGRGAQQGRKVPRLPVEVRPVGVLPDPVRLVHGSVPGYVSRIRRLFGSWNEPIVHSIRLVVHLR